MEKRDGNKPIGSPYNPDYAANTIPLSSMIAHFPQDDPP
jgi:hypothetical protein